MKMQTLAGVFLFVLLLAATVVLARGGRQDGGGGPYFVAFVQTSVEREKHKLGKDYAYRAKLNAAVNQIARDGYKVHSIIEMKDGRLMLLCRR